MNKQNVIAIFDIGKTNKKLLLFDEQYKLVHEESQVFEETKDEDGFVCENIDTLCKWVNEKFLEVCSLDEFAIKAVNFSAYGASMIHIDSEGKILTPLYNYLKPFPEKLKQQFYTTYGGESLLAKQTASPVLGNLNSGLQLYRLKYEQPEIYQQIKYSLHLPQYVSFLISNTATCDITSVGCHTHLWDFQTNKYHNWVYKERLDEKFPAIFNGDKTINITSNNRQIPVGIGLHDSSAALIPYLAAFNEPFVLLSTGTWCISLNPFNHTLLTDYELHNDCLCYLTYEGKPVKASRLFAGYEHEQQLKRLSAHFNTTNDYYKTVVYNDELINKNQVANTKNYIINNALIQQSFFQERSLHDFKNYEEAYHQLILDLVTQQEYSTKLVLSQTPVKHIYVDGGFAKNDVYMNLLAAAFPSLKIYAADVPQASALGAAIAINHHAGDMLPADLIQLKHYPFN